MLQICCFGDLRVSKTFGWRCLAVRWWLNQSSTGRNDDAQAAWQLEDVLHDVNIDVYPDKPAPQFWGLDRWSWATVRNDVIVMWVWVKLQKDQISWRLFCSFDPYPHDNILAFIRKSKLFWRSQSFHGLWLTPIFQLHDPQFLLFTASTTPKWMHRLSLHLIIFGDSVHWGN